MSQVLLRTVLLLMLSNCFMTFAWYGHLRALGHKPWIIAVLVSWGVAFFEYLIQVPANRMGHDGHLTLAQLKIIQEVIYAYRKKQLKQNSSILLSVPGVKHCLAITFIFFAKKDATTANMEKVVRDEKTNSGLFFTIYFINPTDDLNTPFQL